MSMNKLLTWLCQIKSVRNHNLTSTGALHAAESIIIPCTGEKYVEEAILSAQFAAENSSHAKEILIVTDQIIKESEISDKTKKIRAIYFDPEPYTPDTHAYSNIYRSRICKIYAPTYASYNRVLMIDSDLMLLQEPLLPWPEWGIAGSFRKGKMISKFKRSGAKRLPRAMKKTCRPYLPDHLNGAFLAARKEVWEKLSALWIHYYQEIWSELPDNQPPTDQLPLTCALDHLQLSTINAGDDINWPVSKKIGGKPSQIPDFVIGAHGGLPLSEWEKYRADHNALLSFVDSKTTRKVRYETDLTIEKRTPS